MSWYNPNKTLTHNAMFNIVIGNRSCGKSYGLKLRAIKNFKDKGHQFVYLRRFSDELDKSKENYFDDVIFNGEFPDDEITFSDGCYYLNDEVMGFAMALTKAKDIKSSSFPNVWLIIFEEFIIEENGYTHYLKNEVEVFLGLYMSIDRYRGCKVFFLGNNYTMFNPYCLYWDLQLPYNSNVVKKKDGLVLLEMVNDNNFIHERSQTAFGKIVDGTPFAEYAIQNKSRLDSDEFVQRKTEKSSYYFTFRFNSENYGVWVDYSVGKFFVSKDIDPYFKQVYCINLDDHSPNTLLIKNINKNIHFKNFIQGYKDGCVFFETLKIKSITYNVIKMCIGGK